MAKWGKFLDVAPTCSSLHLSQAMAYIQSYIDQSVGCPKRQQNIISYCACGCLHDSGVIKKQSIVLGYSCGVATNKCVYEKSSKYHY